jgi:hypothetical protein
LMPDRSSQDSPDYPADYRVADHFGQLGTIT